MKIHPVVTAYPKMAKGKRLLIFDFDGTLANTSSLHAKAFNKVLSPWGVEVDYPGIAGLRTLDALLVCFAKVGLDVSESKLEQMTIEKQAYVRALMQKELLPLSGVNEFLRWAHPRYRLSIATSGSRTTLQIALAKLNYEGLFDPVVCSDDVQHAKPNPACFLRVLSLTGVPANEALIFEDSSVGVMAAKNAGVECIDVATTHFFKHIHSLIGESRYE